LEFLLSMLPLVMYSYLSFHYASFSSLSISSFRIYDVLQFLLSASTWRSL
jgi:hypothetical protein